MININRATLIATLISLTGCSTSRMWDQATSDTTSYKAARALDGASGQAKLFGVGVLGPVLFGPSLPKQTAVDGCGRKVEEVEPGKFVVLPGQEHIPCNGD